jgi:hypothetical protein
LSFFIANAMCLTIDELSDIIDELVETFPEAQIQETIIALYDTGKGKPMSRTASQRVLKRLSDGFPAVRKTLPRNEKEKNNAMTI